MSGEILDLPALLGADLSALDSTAGASALPGRQFVGMRGDGKTFEIRQLPPATGFPSSWAAKSSIICGNSPADSSRSARGPQYHFLYRAGSCCKRSISTWS
ncbi:MAG: hypothetical protein HYX27_00320 [Acidobacteria bacterium]|nr:hypothetical protein [Acidobacteriota bacterium]